MTESIVDPFEFEGNKVRALSDGNEVVFVASDIAKILGYRDAANLTRNLGNGEKGTHEVSTPSGLQNMTVLTESGLYHAILNRETAYVKDPEAQAFVKRFQRWVTHEVLPSIRKHGAYATRATIEHLINDPDFGIQLLTTLKQEQEKRRQAEATIEAQKPKVLFADSVETAKSSILIGELARDLKQNGVDIGQNRLFQWLRDNMYLISRKGEDRNQPTQRSLNLGLFEVKTRTINNPDGSTRITRTTKVTGKGRIYLTNKFMDQGQPS